MRDRGRVDPVWWIKTVLGHELWEKQREIVEAVRDNRETSAASCHGPGKTFTGADVALWFLYNHKPSIVLTTAPTSRQVEHLLWKEIRKAHSGAKITLGGRLLTKQLTLDDDWYALGFSTSDYDPDKFQGFHEENILVIEDEASGITPVVEEGIDGVMATGNARRLRIGNPTNPVGPFAKSFANPKVAKIHIDAFETPNFTAFGITEENIADGSWREKVTGPLPCPWLVTPEWVDDKYHLWGPDSPIWIARVRGVFPKDSPDSLISLTDVEAAQARELKIGDETILGLDVGRTGPDPSVCYSRCGDVARKVFMSRKEKTTQTTGRMVKAFEDTGAAGANIDVIGIGAGVYDNLDEQGYDVEDINFAASPVGADGKRFVNLKAQLYWNAKGRFEDGRMDLDPTDQEVGPEAVAVKWFVNSKGKIQIEDKKITKKRLGRSPDAFEALVYAFADDVLEMKRDVIII